jgi:nucleotide-binding universal stress UspA family protein
MDIHISVDAEGQEVRPILPVRADCRFSAERPSGDADHDPYARRRCPGRTRHTVIVVHYGDGPSTILVAIDGSDTSMRAGAYAAGMARRQHARLVCVYVRATNTLSSLNPALAGAVHEAHDATAREIRDTIAANVHRIGIEVTFVERVGGPVTEIAAVADEMRVDAVVVGASTQSGHRFVGSIAGHLVRIARWPVTVVP